MKNVLLILLMFFVFCSCNKQNEWLDAKRQKSDVVPSTLEDYQAILDNTINMNSAYPMVGLTGCDNFYIPDENMGTLDVVDRNTYYWNKEIYLGGNPIDYASGYGIVASTNVVLEGLEKLDLTTDVGEAHNVKGQALFFRAIMFYELASVFCKPYVSTSAAMDLGISVRLKTDIFHVEPRSSVKQTYDQIIADLETAAKLLPIVPTYRTRPSKAAAFAQLARTFLVMDDYAQAKRYADSSLSYFDNLLDFNSSDVSLTKPYRFPSFIENNIEIIFYAVGNPIAAYVPIEGLSTGFIDSTLYRSYHENDLRKRYFYGLVGSDRAKFRGSYSGSDKLFSGIAANEVYFIRAESSVRLGLVEASIADLNKILVKRYKSGTYENFTSSDPEIVLRKIIEERRKEFPFTGQIRWQDLRRLNKDARFSKTLFRNTFGVMQQLDPNDPRYVYPIPPAEVQKGGLIQNER